jgi:eukaryotic-like serine/threonine-protein kinase
MSRPANTPSPVAVALPHESRDVAFDARIERFEAAWTAGGAPRIEDYLTGGDLPRRGELLCELICLDLEYRWKAGAAGGLRASLSRPTLEDYVARFAELGPVASLPTDLIAEEYRVRHRWGDRPAHGRFAVRFGDRAEKVAAALRAVDADLQREAPCLPAGDQAPAVAQHRAGQKVAPLNYRDYVLVRLLGSGGMGKVYAARHKQPDLPVAVKMLRKQWSRHPAAVERFVCEAQTIGRLRHRHIVPVHGLGRTPGGGYFIVMELMVGGDLATALATGPAAISDAVRWMRQAAEALAYAHRAGVIHCDVKPSNLLIGRQGDVLLTDFGLARSVASQSQHAGEIAGTLAFMAPEQFGLGAGEIGPATDVYGLGATLYTLLTGRLPVEAVPALSSSLVEIVRLHVAGRLPPAPRKLRPEIPAALDAICLRCLAADPRARFSAMEEVADALRTSMDDRHPPRS